jgi:hypothetical protein
MFWAHHQDLLQCSRDSVSGMIKRIVESHHAVPNRGQRQEISAVKGQILLSTFEDLESQDDDLGIIQIQKPQHDQRAPVIQLSSKRLTIGTYEGKKHQIQFLHQILPAVDRFGRHWLNGSGRRLLVADTDASYDTSVGILMLILALFFDNDGRECPDGQSYEGEALSLHAEIR